MPSFSVTAALTTLLFVEDKVTLTLVAVKYLVCEENRVPTHDDAIVNCNRMNNLLNLDLVLEIES